MQQNIGSKTGSTPIKKIGHTFSNRFGSEPNAKERGRSPEPTEQTFK